MKIEADSKPIHDFKTMLFDLKKDPGQKNLIKDKKVEEKMKTHLINLMKANDAPEEQFERLGLL
jgi:hypothetical protein